MAKGTHRATRQAQQPRPVYEAGKLVGHYCPTWSHDGTRQILVYIPNGDVE